MPTPKIFARISRGKTLAWIWAGVISGILVGLLVWHLLTPSASLSYRYLPGDCLVYQIDYKSFSTADFRLLFQSLDSARKNEEVLQPGSGLFQAFKTTLKGEFIATVLAKMADKFLISFRLQNPLLTLEINRKDALLQAEITSAALKLDIFVEASLQGRIISVWFDPEVDNFSQNVARALLAQTQFVLPDRSKSDFSQWEVQEEDPSGKYMACYELLEDKNKSDSEITKNRLKTFLKTKISYLKQSAQTKLARTTIPTTISPEGSLEGMFDLHTGCLDSLNGSEKQAVMIAGKKVGQAENSINLKFLGKEKIPQSELQAMLEAYGEREKIVRAVSLSVSLSEEEREASIQRSELGQATQESLLADLAKAEAEGKKRDTSLYLKFKALVFVHPEICETLSKLLVTSDPKSLTMGILSEALSVVGHEQAQSVLVGAILARPNDSLALSALVQNLGLVKRPTVLAEKTLHDLAVNSKDRSVAEIALLSLGNVARNLVKKEPQRAARIVDWLIEETRLSNSEERTRLLLLSLGNSGSTSALQTIVRFAANPSPSLRSAAVSGLRWIDSSEADTLLAKILTSDPEISVRLEAVFALSFRPPVPKTFQAQQKAFLEDEAAIVRLSILRNLWQVQNEFPQVRELVKRAAMNDPSEEVRKAAADILASYPKDYFDK